MNSKNNFPLENLLQYINYIQRRSMYRETPLNGLLKDLDTSRFTGIQSILEGYY